MKVSVIIPTYNGATKLPEILDAVLQQNCEPREIIVVVDGSTDNTGVVLEKYSARNHNLRFFFQENGGRASVRNRGAKDASGDLLIFFDDDMVPEPNCIEMHIHHHHQFADSILTGAQIDPNDKTRSDFQLFKNELSLNWANELRSFDKTPLPQSKAYLTAANFSISKSLFDSIGGFDERLTDAEDYDLAVRAQKKGIPLYYNHKAFAWHYDNVTCRSYIQRMRQYANAHDTLIHIKSDVHGTGSKYETIMPKGIRKMIYRFFCSNWWISSVDYGYWYWLPLKIRFKLYAAIITANGTFFPHKVPIKT
jgi:glycosyltransferase involved in cell wall biosynthesis